MTLISIKSSKFNYLAIAALCLSYLIFQLIYIPHTAFSVDEFWFAHHIFEYTHKIPYRDFLPYKTVLGYYLLSIPLYWVGNLLQPLYWIKDEIALINTLFLAGTAFWLTQFFQPRAILATLVLILANQFFLIYSIDLRVDMLTSWLGLLSILCILSNRYLLAGFVLALSFMVSQKALWFWMATNIALGTTGWIAAYRWQSVWRMMKFNAATLIVIMLYVAFWSWHSDLSTVLKNIFYEGYTQSKITWYSQVYYACWHGIFLSGPLLIMLWPLTWISIFIDKANPKTQQQRLFITIYSAIMMLFIIFYQQAFPYNMVFCIPVYFLTYSDFFSWLFTFEPTHLTKQPRYIWFIFCSALSLALNIIFALPLICYLIALLPLFLFIFLDKKYTHLVKAPLFILFIYTGVAYPLLRFELITPKLENTYQTSIITLSSALLNDGGGFFAGTPLFYQHDQAIPGLKNLIHPAIAYLYHPENKILPLMLSSLYLTPRTSQDIIQDLKATPVKFYVNNYRITALPASIRNYLATEFEQYWGSVYLYAPKIRAKNRSFQLKFSGQYQIMSPNGTSIILDQQKILSHDVIKLTKGVHISHANQDYRLKYMPENIDPQFQKKQKDRWKEVIKPLVLM
jgi:hypothetical protein